MKSLERAAEEAVARFFVRSRPMVDWLIWKLLRQQKAQPGLKRQVILEAGGV